MEKLIEYRNSIIKHFYIIAVIAIILFILSQL